MNRGLYLATVLASCLFQMTLLAPINQQDTPKSDSTRKAKNLAFFDYIQPDLVYTNYDTDDYTSLDIEDNEISRTIPSRKPIPQRPAVPNPFNSPIYYIRLPPQPYMFVPGLGYVSQPPPSPVSQFVNLPVSFVANGKPDTIYQWSGGIQNFPTVAPPPLPPQIVPHRPTAPPQPQHKPHKPSDSHIHRLPGQFAFNGKPEDIFVLRDSYNSLYSDALQNFYP